MKVEVNSQALADAVAWTTRVIDARPATPILAGIRLEAIDGTLQLSAFNYAISARHHIEAGVDEAGSVLVLGKLLADITKSLPAAKTYLSTDGSTMTITSGKSTFTMQLMPESEYPDLPVVPTKLGQVDSPTFAQAVNQASGVKKDEKIAKMLPSSVTKDGKLTVGMDTSYAPAEFLAADGKTPVGFDVDIAKALAGVFGLEADPETANFDSIIPAVGAKYDIGISSFTVTKERLEAVDFVSHFNAGSAWAVKKGNPNKVDTSDLCGKKVAVQTATMQETAANKMAKQCKADGKAEMDVISSKLQTDVTTNVVTGKADVFYADSPVAGYAISQTDDQLEAFGEDVGVTKEAVAIKKGDSDTAKAVQAAMQKLMDDGTYMKILKHWGVESGAVDKAEINPTDLG